VRRDRFDAQILHRLNQSKLSDRFFFPQTNSAHAGISDEMDR